VRSTVPGTWWRCGEAQRKFAAATRRGFEAAHVTSVVSTPADRAISRGRSAAVGQPRISGGTEDITGRERVIATRARGRPPRSANGAASASIIHLQRHPRNHFVARGAQRLRVPASRDRKPVQRRNDGKRACEKSRCGNQAARRQLVYCPAVQP
jgi:hypothetical protein